MAEKDFGSEPTLIKIPLPVGVEDTPEIRHQMQEYLKSIGKYKCHGLDTQERVRFYEPDFYMLSNFSSFRVSWWMSNFSTAEHAYQWKKFHYQADSPSSHRVLEKN